MKKLIIGINGKLYELFMFLFVQSGKSTYVHTMINAGTCVAVGWRAILSKLFQSKFQKTVRKLVTNFARQKGDFMPKNVQPQPPLIDNSRTDLIRREKKQNSTCAVRQ